MTEVPCHLVLDDIGKRSEALKRKKTNADRIRAMTDEELARAFADACPVSGTVNRCCKYFEKGSRGCYDCWLDWLRQEAGQCTK